MHSVANVPFKEEANHVGMYSATHMRLPSLITAAYEDLPDHLKNPRWYKNGKIHNKPKTEYQSKASCTFFSRPTRLMTLLSAIYGRVQGKWHFQTALTSANPNAKGGRLLHPTVRPVLFPSSQWRHSRCNECSKNAF